MAIDPKVAILVQRLSRYLRDHPHASDTQQGIARWWLEPDPMYETAQLDAALRWLERRGLIEPLHAADGRVRYRRTDTSAASDATLEALARSGTAIDGPNGFD